MSGKQWLLKALLVASTLVASCRYEDRPVPGVVTCGAGSKQCPDGYECYRGSAGTNCAGTCWPVGRKPDPTTVCRSGGADARDAVDVDADAERTGGAGGAGTGGTG